MAAFSTSNLMGGSPAVSTAYKSFLGLTAATATLTSASIVEFAVSVDAAPADNVLTWQAVRTNTDIGTGTTVTPSPLDSSKRAAGTVARANHSVEPGGIGVELWTMAVNQRASFRWVAVPGSELIIPATNVNGISLRAKSPAYTGTCTCQAGHTE